MRLWIDTDVQPDDLVALLCAVGHPAVELVGVSVVDDPDGSGHRLAAATVGETLVRRLDRWALVDVDALLAIGPLTNIAALLAADGRPRRIVVMGGALGTVDYRGRRVSVEHNFGRDPAAAANVLDAAPVELVPLDTTAPLRLDASGERRILAAWPELFEPVRVWRSALQADGAIDDGLGLHDPIALLVATGDLDADSECRQLRVEPDGGVRSDPVGRQHNVIVAVNEHAATEQIVALVEQARR